MGSANPAAQAIIEALKAPDLAHQKRLALLSALETLSGSPMVPRTRQQPAPAPSARRAESLKLTRESIAALPLPAAGERYVYDTACPQLAVRIRPGGKTFMVVMWDRDRHRAIKHTLGKVEKLMPEQARRDAQALVSSVAAGDDVRRTRVAGVTVGQLVEAWHAEKAKSKRTADEMRDKALAYLGRLQAMPAADVTREHVGGIHHHIATAARRRVVKHVDGELRTVEVGKVGIPPTADKWLAIMSSIFGWAMTKGLAVANPCRGIKKAANAKESARQTYLHGESLLRFWAALHADADADVRDLLLLALFTGQRKGNLVGMRWDDLDLGAGLWTISAEQTKQRKPQTTPLSAQAQAILDRRRLDAGTPWVFPATRRNAEGEIGCMSVTRPREAWARICQAANIEGVRIHDLRHTAGSWLARLGANEAVRQKALGHQTPQMAARYSHLELDPVAAAMQLMGDALTAAATKPATKPAAKSRRKGRAPK